MESVRPEPADATAKDSIAPPSTAKDSNAPPSTGTEDSSSHTQLPVCATRAAPELAWHALNLQWAVGPDHLYTTRIPHSVLPPAWQMLLLGDGSPTKQLGLLTGLPTKVEILEMVPVAQDENDGAPPDVASIQQPRTRRQVILSNDSKIPLVYATSWWESSAIEDHLRDTKLPIWVSMTQSRCELYREIRNVYFGTSDRLEAIFGAKGPFWGRNYLFWHKGKVLTLIYEVFSPHLCRYIGQYHDPQGTEVV